MKDFCLEAHVHFPAEDVAHACEQLAEYFLAQAEVHRGTGTVDSLRIADWAPRSVLILKPHNPGDMN